MTVPPPAAAALGLDLVRLVVDALHLLADAGPDPDLPLVGRRTARPAHARQAHARPAHALLGHVTAMA